MLQNFWYVVEQSSGVQEKPQRVTLLGKTLVLFRTETGQVVALDNFCSHRGAALSDGKVVNNCIQCPYHGWQYQSDGRCVDIPTQLPGASIPKSAKVKAYPACEAHGWVWVFIGSLPEAERPPIPDLPELNQPVWRAVYGHFKWNANYTHVIENNIDIAHTPYVHGFEPQVPAYDVQMSEWSGSMSVQLKPPVPKGLWKWLRSGDRPDVKTTATFYMPCITRLDIDLGKFQFVLFGVHTPLNETETLTHWVQLRNFFTHPWADRDARRRNQKAFLEDQHVVESQCKDSNLVKLATPSDALATEYLKLHQHYLNLGWGINTAHPPTGITAHQEQELNPSAIIWEGESALPLGQLM
jgi:phenylpropionate dioxygenase-like ring-hydroxylating dioxygenase large terminal subunit